MFKKLAAIYKFIKEQKEEVYLTRLGYARANLSNTIDNKYLDKERAMTFRAVNWLYAYYNEIPEAMAEGSPDVRLSKLLSKLSGDITGEDYIFIKVLYNWKMYKRVEGY